MERRKDVLLQIVAVYVLICLLSMNHDLVTSLIATICIYFVQLKYVTCNHILYNHEDIIESQLIPFSLLPNQATMKFSQLPRCYKNAIENVNYFSVVYKEVLVKQLIIREGW